MDVAVTKKTASLTTYVIGLCRKFKIFPSERTTVVTHNEEMQILQYCSALHNKKACSTFDANPKLCEKMHSEMVSRRVEKLIADVQAKIFSNGDGQSNFDLSNSNEMNNKSDKVDSKDVVSRNDDLSAHEEKNDSTNTEIKIEVDGVDSSVTSLFLESLKSSNHFTLLDVFEKFLDEVVNKESILHAFVKSDFKANMYVCENTSLQKVEVLTIDILKTIAGIDCPKEGDIRNENFLQDIETVQSVSLSQSDKSRDVMSSPSAMRTNDTPQKLRSAKTPVQVFKSRHQLTSPLPTAPFTPSTDVERRQLLKKFIESIFRCYLHLLVNTRCELALALVFNIPERELDHKAFTHLKHASAESGLSMYQTMSSILMRFRLGGNAYALPSDSPLLLYIKGLGCLFDFVDKLQTCIEESPSPRSGCKRLVNILSRNISMCKSRRFPSSVVESVANGVWESLDDILSTMEKESKEEDSGESESQEGIVIGQESIDAFMSYLDQSSDSVSDVDRYFLGDVRFSQDTPTRFPCFMSRFRSPLSNVEEEGEDMDKESTTKKSDTFQHPVCKVSEALYLDEDETDKIVCTPLDMDNVYVIPSKTIVHPKCGADYGETSESIFSPVSKPTNQKVQKKRVPGKRKKKADVISCNEDHGKEQVDENSPLPKSRKNVDRNEDGDKSTRDVVLSGVNAKGKGSDGNNKKQTKSCRRKLLPQIKGQSKLTGFFKV